MEKLDVDGWISEDHSKEWEKLRYPASGDEAHFWEPRAFGEETVCKWCSNQEFAEQHRKAISIQQKTLKHVQKRLDKVKRIYTESVWVVNKGTVITAVAIYIVVNFIAAIIRNL
jgi:hypothetical protein